MGSVRGMIKGVIFDFDMTLVDYNRSDRSALARVLELSGLNIGLEEFRELSGSIVEKAFDGKCSDFANIHRYRLEETVKCFGGKFQEAFLDEYYKIYLHTVPVYSGAEDMLRFLKDKVKLGLLTNAVDPWEQKARIAASKLEPYFDVIGIGYDIGAYKPELEAFTWMSDKLNLGREEILFIGDSEKHDIVGAKNAGFKTIKKIYPGHKPTIADDVFTAYGDLYEILEKKYAIGE